jgi:hypothetical protein
MTVQSEPLQHTPSAASFNTREKRERKQYNAATFRNFEQEVEETVAVGQLVWHNQKQSSTVGKVNMRIVQSCCRIITPAVVSG